MLARSFVVALFSAIWVLTLGLGDTAGQPYRLPPYFRKLTPGLLTVVRSEPRDGEMFTGPGNLLDLETVDFKPNFDPKTDTLHERVKSVVFQRPIWNLEFAFKPLRLQEVDVPQANGVYQKKVIWYLIYRIRNVGKALTPDPKSDQWLSDKARDLGLSPEELAKALGRREREQLTYDRKLVDHLDAMTMGDRFYPQIVLEGWIHNFNTGEYTKKAYLDRLIPAAIPRILSKEVIPPAKPVLKDEDNNFVRDKNGYPVIVLNKVQMPQVKIELSDENNDNSVWGIATWEDLDPRIDYLSVYVRGLTNAFRLEFDKDHTPRYQYKTLKINFWRPGDSTDEAKDTVFTGVRLLKNPAEQLKLFDLYEVDGPMIAGYEVTESSAPEREGTPYELEHPLFRIDAQPTATMETKLLEPLATGRALPQEIVNAFAEQGIDVPSGIIPSAVVPKKQWQMDVNVGGENRRFVLRYEPQKWEMTERGIKIRSQLDYSWIYR